MQEYAEDIKALVRGARLCSDAGHDDDECVPPDHIAL